MEKINYLGEKSLSVILRYIVNFLWYIQLVIISLILLKSLIHSFSPENSFSWPVSFVATVQEVASQNPDISVSGIQVIEGTLMFGTRDDWHANTIMMLGVLFMAAPFLMVTFQVRKILGNFVSDDPFLKPNLRRIRLIGIILVIYPILAYIFGFFYTRYLNFNFDGYEFVNSVELWPLLFGLFSLIVSEVFRLGVEYREDNNLTI